MNEIYIVKTSNGSASVDYFIEFIDAVNKYIKLKDYFKKKKMTVVLENSRVHKKSKVIHELSNTFENVVFIPLYTSQFAPYKLLFEMIKSKIRSLDFNKTKNIIENK